MRAVNVVLWPVVLVSLFLLTLLTAGFSQDLSGADVSRDLRREWFSLAHGRTDFDVSDPESVPSFLRLAAEQSGCRYKDGLKIAPVHFLRVANDQLALVPCGGSLRTTQRAFDL